MSKVKVTDRMPQFIRENKLACDVALDNMGRDLANIAKIKQPFKEGDMMKETYHEKIGPLKHHVIVNTEYASYHEKGHRFDGSRVVKNYTTPNTGKGFLGGAATDIFRNGVNYFRQAVNIIRMGL